MRSLAIPAITLAALTAAAPALAQSDSGVGAPPVVRSAPPSTAVPAAPVATAAVSAETYVQPGYGFQLPRNWMVPQNFIADYRSYRLDRPAPGFGWSRYYDDAVLTDQWGRVYAVRQGVDWARRYDGRAERRRDTDGVIGGVVGAGLGTAAGYAIAGQGSRLAGSLIGGGVGALIGLGIELAIKNDRRHGRGYRDYGYDYDYPRGAHWGGYGYGQAWATAGGCGCETVTTTTTTTTTGGGHLVRRVSYEYVDVPVRPAPAKIMRRSVKGTPVEAPRRTIKHQRRIGE